MIYTQIASKPADAKREAWHRYLLTALRRREPWGHLELGLPSSRAARESPSAGDAPPSVLLCYSSPSKRMRSAWPARKHPCSSLDCSGSSGIWLWPVYWHLPPFCPVETESIGSRPFLGFLEHDFVAHIPWLSCHIMFLF